MLGWIKKYYSQTLLEECKYRIKKKKNVINNDLDSNSSDNGLMMNLVINLVMNLVMEKTDESIN